MKVLVTSRSFGQITGKAAKILNDAGFEITYMFKYEKEGFEQAITDYDALIIGGHPFPAELLDRCEKLKMILKHGVGLDNIPVEACGKHGVCVTNAPGANAEAVADFAVMLMMASSRKLMYSANEIKKGNFKANYGTDFHGKTVGLLGFGRIARYVAKRAAGFGCRVLTYDPYVKELPAEFADVRICDFTEVLSESDFVSIHLPLTDETYHMIGREELSLMKNTAYLINTARGGIIDEDELLNAVENGTIAGAALDVIEHEPVPVDSNLLANPDILITNHVASYSKEALDAISILCANNIVKYFGGEEPVNRVI